MKKIRLIVEVECKNSTRVSEIESDMADGLLCGNVKQLRIEFEDNGLRETTNFVNAEFEEE